MLEQLKDRFKDEEFFTRESLLAFYREFDPELSNSTFRWRIHQLKANRVITPITRNLFSFGCKPVFKPDLTEFEKKTARKIEAQFSDMKYAIWTTRSVNEFSIHMSARFITILQVETDALEPVYAFLKKQNVGTVYFQPDEKEIERYIFESEKSIVLQSLITKAPTQYTGKVATITIEKMIVDLFCEKDLFISFQGSELIHILNTAYDRYSINFTTMFHYARRRGKEIDLRQYLKDKTDIPKIIIDDKR